jgi:hypothetical protein
VNNRRFQVRLRMLLPFLLVVVTMLLSAAYGGIAQDAPWHTVRKYCLLVLLVITWVLIAACVIGGIDLCIHLARRLGLSRSRETIPDYSSDRPAIEIDSR